MKHITSVQASKDHKLKLCFDDGVEGVIDLSREAGKGIFAAWNDAKHFAAVRIARGGRALEWSGEIDLCADTLYLEITGKKPEDVFPALRSETTHA
jgi:hypothetical protein